MNVLGLTHEELVMRAEKWMLQKYKVVLTEYKTYAPAIPDVIGFNNAYSCVVECKVSRQDFLHDKYKHHRNGKAQLGNQRWYMVLPNILSVEDIPDGWGLLYVEANCIRKIKPAPFHTEPEIKAAEYSILYSIARRALGHNLLSKILEPY